MCVVNLFLSLHSRGEIRHFVKAVTYVTRSNDSTTRRQPCFQSLYIHPFAKRWLYHERIDIRAVCFSMSLSTRGETARMRKRPCREGNPPLPRGIGGKVAGLSPRRERGKKSWHLKSWRSHRYAGGRRCKKWPLPIQGGGKIVTVLFSQGEGVTILDPLSM